MASPGPHTKSFGDLEEMERMREDINIVDGENFEMGPETKNVIAKIFDYWSNRFSSLHQEAVYAIAKHDVLDQQINAAMRKIDADMERRSAPRSATVSLP